MVRHTVNMGPLQLPMLPWRTTHFSCWLKIVWENTKKGHWKALIGWCLMTLPDWTLKFPTEAVPHPPIVFVLLLRISQFTVVLVADLMWTRLVAYHFLLGRCYFLFTLCYWACASFHSGVCEGEVKRWTRVKCFAMYRPVVIYHAHLVARSSVRNDLLGDVRFFWLICNIWSHEDIPVFDCDMVGAFSALSCSGTILGKPPAIWSSIEIKKSRDRKAQVATRKKVEAVSFEPFLSKKHLRNICPSKIRDWNIPSRCNCILQFLYILHCHVSLHCHRLIWNILTKFGQ